MKMQIKEGGGVGFVNKEDYEYEGKKYEADLKEGDTVTILDGGNKEEGKFGEQMNFVIQTRNGEKKLSFNQSTINVLIKELGEESLEWVGKEVRVILQRKVIAGKKVIIPYLVVGDWAIDSWNELSKPKVVGGIVDKPQEKEIDVNDLDKINANIK